MTRTSAQQALPFLVAALLAACGGKWSSGGHDRNEGGSSTNGGSTAGGGTTSQAGSASTSGSGGQASSCDAFPNEPGWPVSVRFVNATQRPLFLGPEVPGCGLGPLFYIGDSSGLALQDPRFCLSTCQDLALGQTVACPPIPCIVSSVVTLQPGEAFRQMWSGSYVKNETLPAGCPAGSDGADCLRVVAVKPDWFTFTAVAGTALDCTPFGGTCTACMPDNNGGCTTYGAVVAGPQLPAVTSVLLDGSYGVGPNGAEPRSVDLVFKE